MKVIHPKTFTACKLQTFSLAGLPFSDMIWRAGSEQHGESKTKTRLQIGIKQVKESKRRVPVLSCLAPSFPSTGFFLSVSVSILVRIFNLLTPCHANEHAYESKSNSKREREQWALSPATFQPLFLAGSLPTPEPEFPGAQHEENEVASQRFN